MIGMKYKDKIDLYGEDGKLIESNVPLEAISPILNPAIKKILQIVIKTVAVNLEGVEKALANGTVGGEGCKIPGREMKLDVVKNANVIAEKVKEKIQAKKGDDTEVTVLGGGKALLVKTPMARTEASAEYTTSLTNVAAAVTQTIIDVFNVSMFDADMVKAAVWGRYPQSINLMGSNLASVLGVPQANEGLGYALRNISASYVATICKKNALNTSALSSILEQSAAFEMGDAVGDFERMQLLGLAFQGLNANNLVYDLVKENGKSGTVGTVIASLVKRALKDKVIRPLEKNESGFVTYTTDDMALWNAYAGAGLLAATMVSTGSMRAMQGVSAVVVYFNDLLEHETGLPSVEFGKSMGTGVEFSFFSHSIYGGGSPVVFHGNHIVTRHSKGFSIPPVAAAIALDAGTVYYTPEKVAGIIGEVFSTIPELREPIAHVAKAAAEVKGSL